MTYQTLQGRAEVEKAKAVRRHQKSLDQLPDTFSAAEAAAAWGVPMARARNVFKYMLTARMITSSGFKSTHRYHKVLPKKEVSGG